MNKVVRILTALGAVAAICLGLLGRGAWAGNAQTPQAYGFVINEDGNSITVIEAATSKVLTVHDMNGTLNKPHLSAYDPATRRLYVGNKGANFVVLDMTDVMAPKVGSPSLSVERLLRRPVHADVANRISLYRMRYA